MKFIATVLLATLSFAAQAAETITLYPSSCTSTRQCSNVANSDEQGVAHDVDLLASPSYTSIWLSIDGQVFTSPTGGGSGNISAVVLTDAQTGEQVVLTVNFRHWTTVNRSGHNYYVQHWAIVDGTIQK